MNKKVSLALLLAASTLFMGCDKVKGVEKNTTAPQNQQTSTQQTQANTQGQPLPAMQPSQPEPSQQELMLKIFNQSVNIVAISRSIAQDNKKNDSVLIGYKIENKGQKAIASVAWRSVFTLNNQVVHTTNVGINLAQQPIQPGATIEAKALDLFKAMPKQTQDIFKNPNQSLNILFVAREITFSDGSKVVISE